MTRPYFITGAIVLDPVSPANLPVNAIYQDGVSQAVSIKASTGTTTPVGQGATAADSLFTKIMHNLSGVTITAGTPVAKKSDGTIIAAAAGIVGNMLLVGVAADTIMNNAQGRVVTIGANILGALTNSGYTFYPGQAVYVNDQGGYTGDTSSLNFSADAILRIGFADCAAGIASTTANDLIAFADVVSSL